MDQYGWVIITTIAFILTTYNTYLSIRDRGKKPVDDLKKEFIALDKTVATLTTTITLLNEHLSNFISDDRKSHKDMREDITSCRETLHEHEGRISSIEKQIHTNG